MQEVLITGGAGFIGSNLALELQERYPQADIIIVDDFRSGDFKNLIDFKGTLIVEDVSKDSFVKLLEKSRFDVIFHMASITDTRITDQQIVLKVNVDGFRNVLEIARKSDALVVYASSAAVYGKGSQKMKETDKPSPANVYGFSKCLIERMAQSSGLCTIGLRYFNVYGPGESHKGTYASMIYQLAKQIVAGKRPRLFKYGQQKRDFVYIKDVVEATVQASIKRQPGIYNVATGRARSFNEIIQILNKYLNTNFEPEYFDNPYDFYQEFTEADISLAKSAFGYNPQYDLEQGIQEYLQWLKQAKS